MLKDITIGQYFPGKSVLHRLDPRMKILLTVGLYWSCCLRIQSVGAVRGYFIFNLCLCDFRYSAPHDYQKLKAGDSYYHFYHRAEHVFRQRRPAV